MKRALPFVIIVMVLAAAVGVAWYWKQVSVTPSPTPTPAPTTSSAKTPPPISETGAQPAHQRGLASAPVTIEEFGDFQCPPCGALHPILKGLETEFGPSRLRVIFRQFPL